jgi:hypothetical protein
VPGVPRRSVYERTIRRIAMADTVGRVAFGEPHVMTDRDIEERRKLLTAQSEQLIMQHKLIAIETLCYKNPNVPLSSVILAIIEKKY